MPTKYAKIGQRVRIIRPLLFVRCGYPLTARILQDDPKQRTEIERLAQNAMAAIGAHQRSAPDFVKAVTSSVLNQKQFGGCQRMIYEVEEPALAGQIVTVTDKQYVKTGTYSAGGYTGSSYYGEGEWEPPELLDAEVHCIYKTDAPAVNCVTISSGNGWIEIESEFSTLRASWPYRIDARHTEMVSE